MLTIQIYAVHSTAVIEVWWVLEFRRAGQWRRMDGGRMLPNEVMLWPDNGRWRAESQDSASVNSERACVRGCIASWGALTRVDEAGR